MRYCAEQVSEVFSKLFRMCAEHNQIPMILTTSTIVPIAKSRNAKELSDFRQVALTSLVMKTFEKVIKDKIVSLIDGKLDPLQFAGTIRPVRVSMMQNFLY